MALKCFTVDHNGMWIGGDVLVFAENEQQAIELAEQALIEARVTDGAPFEATEHKMELGATVLSTGDY